MTPNEVTGIIVVIGAQIVGPMVAYAKSAATSRAESERINADRMATAAKRDTEHQLLKQEVEHLKCELLKIDKMAESVSNVEKIVARMDGVFSMLVKSQNTNQPT